MLMVSEQDNASAAKAQTARPGNVLAFLSESEVEQHELPLTFPKLVPTLCTCQGQAEPSP